MNGFDAYVLVLVPLSSKPPKRSRGQMIQELLKNFHPAFASWRIYDKIDPSSAVVGGTRLGRARGCL
eukprot:Nitzschia sp. Nitz4//scaffold18_size181773//26504//26704//NITZ4_001898-RA/size181773-exonerate_est2genome-gene-0.113-mRNA-1//-1//CDS//3329539960//1706//frame0